MASYLPLLGALAVTVTIALATVGWLRRSVRALPITEQDAAYRARARRLVLWLLPVAVVLQVAAYLGQRAVASAAPAPTLIVDGDRVLSQALRLQMPVAAGWQVMSGVPVDVALRNDAQGALLIGTATVSDPRGDSAAVTVGKVVDGRRTRWGRLQDELRGERALAGHPASTASFTIEGPNGPVRSEVTVAVIDDYTLSFTCTAPAASFADAKVACDALLAGLGASPR